MAFAVKWQKSVGRAVIALSAWCQYLLSGTFNSRRNVACARVYQLRPNGTHEKSGRPDACKSHQRAAAAATPTISIILLVNSWKRLNSGRQLVFYPWPTCAFDAISMGNLTHSHNLLDTTVRGEAANKMPPDTVARARARSVNLTFGQLNWVNKPQPARRMESFNLFARSFVSNCN